ncbi:hypothetical protein RF11_08971 [Thelohanellus kitauei]|uniref:Uncharacterized protein n=1 Tax=Thelohanellus kitauei TaxID=669202 RepID=A0A0C2M6Y3_THEKT|nr:hypothetical protein RF11_08971 [Thelohanellus kitauei]
MALFHLQVIRKWSRNITIPISINPLSFQPISSSVYGAYYQMIITQRNIKYPLLLGSTRLKDNEIRIIYEKDYEIGEHLNILEFFMVALLIENVREKNALLT